MFSGINEFLLEVDTPVTTPSPSANHSLEGKKCQFIILIQSLCLDHQKDWLWVILKSF